MSSPLYWMRLEVERFARAMAPLNDREFRVLMELIWHCWATGQNEFGSDLERTARIVHVDARELRSMIPTLMSTGLLDHVDQMRKEQLAKIAANMPPTVVPFGVKK